MLKQLTGVSTSTNWLSSFTVDFCWKTIETILWLKLDADLALSLVSQERIPDEEYRGILSCMYSFILLGAVQKPQDALFDHYVMLSPPTPNNEVDHSEK